MITDASRESAGQSSLALAQAMVKQLRVELNDEIGWLENDGEDAPAAMIAPLDRAEVQYIYSTGRRREFGPRDKKGEELKAEEGTPLLPDNDGLSTSPGSNEVMRVSGWAGGAGFLTGYAESAIAGPLTRAPSGLNGSSTDRFRLLRGEVVTDFGNSALSFGREEMYWGSGYYGSLSQGNNAEPFTALRIQNVHPSYLSGFLKYLGPFRAHAFIGQLDHDRQFSRPWISGQIIVFKPLPTLEFGITHVVVFGGRGNDNYGLLGFVGRATGLATGNALQSNTNSQAGVMTKFYFPSLRNSYVFLDIVSEDNATAEIPVIGRAVPIVAMSFKTGLVIPRLTADGRTMARMESNITSQRLDFHSDSLYWTYDNRLMGDPLGANTFGVHLAVGRWLSKSSRLDLDLFHTERDPSFPGAWTEHGDGFSLGMAQMPQSLGPLRRELLGFKGYFALEYVRNLNNVRNANTLRAALLLSASLSPTHPTVVRDK